MSNIKNLNDYFYKMEQIELNSGRIIYLVHLNQGRTYGDQLEGLPTFRGIPTTEPRIIDINGKRTLLVDRSPVPLPISDEEKERHLKNHRVSKSDYPLTSVAPVTCRAHFESTPTANADEDAWASALTMEWYQEDFAMPIAPRILEKIKAINWDDLAEDLLFP